MISPGKAGAPPWEQQVPFIYEIVLCEHWDGGMMTTAECSVRPRLFSGGVGWGRSRQATMPTRPLCPAHSEGTAL